MQPAAASGADALESQALHARHKLLSYELRLVPA